MTEDIVPFACCFSLSGLLVSRHSKMAYVKPTECGLYSDDIPEVRRIPAQFHALHDFSFLQAGLTSFPYQVICYTTARSSKLLQGRRHCMYIISVSRETNDCFL